MVLLLEHGGVKLWAERVNHCKHPITKVSIALSKCHLHCIGVETQAEYAALIQKPPQHATAPLAAHEPPNVGLLVLLGQAITHILVGLGALLTSYIEGVVVTHMNNLLAQKTYMGTYPVSMCRIMIMQPIMVRIAKQAAPPIM
jgi:hypothetical protein